MLVFALLAVVIVSIIVAFVQQKSLTTVFGYGACFVVSGSMEPTLSVNDVIVVKETDSPQVGDMLLYRSGNELVVHRVVEVINNGETVITRGDANEVNDPPVSRSEFIGRVVWVIPKLGNVIAFFKSVYGVIALFSLCAVVYIGVYLVKQVTKKPVEDSVNNE